MGRMTLSTKNRVGLALAGLLGVLDIVAYFFPPDPDAGMPGPPPSILLLGLVLGLVTVLAVAVAFKSAPKVAIWTTVASRVLSALTAVPAYFVGVPTVVLVLVTAFIAATVVSVALTLSKKA